MAAVIGIADECGPTRLARVAGITPSQARTPLSWLKQGWVRLLAALAVALLLATAPRDVWAQAANQCTLANASPIISSPADSGWLNDNAGVLTHTPALSGAQTTTRLGTEANGAIRIAGELQWNNSNGANSGRATMNIFVNGIAYATLFTSESSAGQNSAAGEFWPQNGSLVSVAGAAETATQQAFIGDAASTGRTYRAFTIRLPLSVAQVTSIRYEFRSNYDNGQTDDDIRFRNIQINQCKATLRIQKAIVAGRVAATDQFSLSIANSSGTLAATTTTGTGTTVNNGIATIAPFVAGIAHTLSEAASGTTVLTNYDSTYACTNASSGTGTSLPTGTGTSFGITPVSGDDITCTVTNTRRPTTLTLTKVSVGGARAFTFTGNNGWTSQTLTTTAPSVGVTGATQTLTSPGTATTITETMPTGFVLSSVTCTGMGTGGTVTPAASSFTLNAAAVAAGSNIACTVTNSVQSQPVFPTCPSTMYLSQGPNANTNTTLYNISTTTNPFTYPAIGQGTNVYNGAAFNPVDNYLYAINHGGGTGNRLIRIGANGSTVDLGPVAGMATADWINGTFSDTGVMYVLAGGGSTNLRAIDVQNNTSTLITLSSSVQASDGLIYTVQAGGQLRSINPVTGAVTSIGSPSGTADYGAMFGSPTGLFGNANTGGFYSFDLATGARTLISSSPGASVNDGASCPTAPITFAADLSVTKTNTPASGPNDLAGDTYVAGQARTYSVVVINNGPFGAQNVVVSDPVPTGISAATMSWTCASTSGGAACGASSGTGALNDTGLDLPPGAVATYLVTMTVPAGFTGDLTNTVTITPPITINDSNAANNTATDVDQAASADLSITKTDGVTQYAPGDTLTYTIVASNAGPGSADNAVFTDPAVSGLTAGSVTCGSAAGGAACPVVANTTVALMQGTGIVVPTLPAGGSVTFTVTATVNAGTTGTLVNTATIALPTGLTDPTPGNNSASDSNTGPLTLPLSCAANTLYTVDQTTRVLSQINAASGASTLITTLPLPPGGVAGTTLINAMGIPPGGGSRLYIAVAGNSPVGAKGAILTYDTVAATSTYSAGAPAVEVAAYAGNFVAGAVNPVNGWFYFAIAQTAGAANTVWGLFGYNPSTGAAPIRVGEITGVTGNNGDLAFDGLGNLYLLTGNATTNFIIYRVNGPMPTTSGAGSLPGTAVTPPISSAVNFGGIAFNNGLLVAQAGTALYLFDPATGAQVGSTVASIAGADLASCGYPNTLRLQKALPNGRVVASNQFTLTITGGGVSTGNTATTTGNATGLQPVVAGAVLGQVGTSYTITETASGGTTLANYTSTWQCVDATNGNASIASGSGASGTFAMPNGGNTGVDALCTITNALQLVDVQVVKTATPDPVLTGEVVTYSIVVTNAGPAAATNVVLTDAPGTGLTCTIPSATASCTATGGASCPAPTVPVADLLAAGVTIPSLPVGGLVTVVLQCTVTASGL